MNVMTPIVHDPNQQKFDTTDHLAHAAQQAEDRRYEDFMIIDVVWLQSPTLAGQTGERDRHRLGIGSAVASRGGKRPSGCSASTSGSISNYDRSRDRALVRCVRASGRANQGWRSL